MCLLVPGNRKSTTNVNPKDKMSVIKTNFNTAKCFSSVLFFGQGRTLSTLLVEYDLTLQITFFAKPQSTTLVEEL